MEDIDYVAKRDALIPKAHRTARSITMKLRLSRQWESKEHWREVNDRVHAGVFSSAMDTLAHRYGLTRIPPRKPLEFWEQEADRWMACGKALQK